MASIHVEALKNIDFPYMLAQKKIRLIIHHSCIRCVLIRSRRARSWFTAPAIEIFLTVSYNHQLHPCAGCYRPVWELATVAIEYHPRKSFATPIFHDENMITVHSPVMMTISSTRITTHNTNHAG